ncbi:MAG: glycosyl hydrolase [Candidatus Saganbacteria bacterium]|nr:glycosyl hydrolase [Candidatus Saganbacteria bacterium]
MPNNRSFSVLIILAASLFLAVHSGCEKYSSSSDKVYGKIAADPSGCYIGAFVTGTTNISGYESDIGTKLACVMWYINFTQDFPKTDCDSVIANGSIPCITWEPWKGVIPDESYSLQNIIDGDFDTYINSWAVSAKNFKYPIFVRFAHEMNGNWYPWDGSHNGGSSGGPAKYISAWRHVYTIFRDAGAENVTWVWDVNADSVPADDWNKAENYYPGDAYVDWISVDGYNWGTSSAGTSWQDFDSIFLSAYNTLYEDHSGKPIMIGETASTEDGGSKSDWIKDAFDKLRTKYAGIKLFNWFNIDKETDWRIQSSASAKQAMKDAMTGSKYFISKIPLN